MGSNTIPTLFHDEWLDIYFEDLTPEEVGVVTIAVMTYARTGEIPDIKDRTVRMVFKQLKQSVDRDRAKYEEKCEKNRQNAKARWDKCDRMQSDANGFDRMQSDAKLCEAMRTDAKLCEDMPTDAKNANNTIYNNTIDNICHDLTISNINNIQGDQSESESDKKDEPCHFFNEKYEVPSRDKVQDYFAQMVKTDGIGKNLEAEKFYDYYDRQDWKINGQPIQYWMSVADRWISNIRDRKKPKKSKYINYEQRDESYNGLESLLLTR